MPFSLVYLERASGYGASGGQSFRNNVTGAEDGAGMTDYKCDGWSFSGEPAPELTYNEGAHFTLPITFSQGTRAGFIKRVGTNVLTIAPALSPAGFDVYNTSHSIVAEPSGSYADLYVHAPYGGTISYASSVWFRDYTSPAQPSDASGQAVRFQGVVQSSGASGTEQCSFSLSYAPDTGPFNPTLTQEFSLTMARRDYNTSASNYLWEWYEDSSYSILLSTSDHYDVTSFPGDHVEVYLRGRQTVSDPWQNIGLVAWTDPRNEV